MVVNLNDFIQVYENVLDKNICDYIIQIFENNFTLQEKIKNNGVPNFTQVNLTKNHKLNDKIDNIHSFLISKVFEYKKKYYSLFNEKCFPKQNSFEEFRIKKYNSGGEDFFDTHVDVLDHNSSRRFLSFMWYLNDVYNGGETVFENLTISPKQGSMVIFPPLWLFPHKGNPPISNTKYILTTYLHYT